MAKFNVTQQADYVTGHIREAHREGTIEAQSAEEALEMLRDGYDEELDLVVDDYEIEDIDYGYNAFEIKEVRE